MTELVEGEPLRNLQHVVVRIFAVNSFFNILLSQSRLSNCNLFRCHNGMKIFQKRGNLLGLVHHIVIHSFVNKHRSTNRVFFKRLGKNAHNVIHMHILPNRTTKCRPTAASKMANPT